MTQYFRVTAYHPAEDVSAVFDSNGMFEKLWQFSSFLLSKGFKVLEVSADEKFIDVNVGKAEPKPDKIILRASDRGKPKYIEHEVKGRIYSAVQVRNKIYIPDKGTAEV